jgi:hypothetical protein
MLLCGGNFQDHLALCGRSTFIRHTTTSWERRLAKGVVSVPEQEENVCQVCVVGAPEGTSSIRLDPPDPDIQALRDCIEIWEPTAVGGKKSQREEVWREHFGKKSCTRMQCGIYRPTIFDKI